MLLTTSDVLVECKLSHSNLVSSPMVWFSLSYWRNRGARNSLTDIVEVWRGRKDGGISRGGRCHDRVVGAADLRSRFTNTNAAYDSHHPFHVCFLASLFPLLPVAHRTFPSTASLSRSGKAPWRPRWSRAASSLTRKHTTVFISAIG